MKTENEKEPTEEANREQADFMERIRNEAQDAYQTECKKNIRFTVWLTLAGFVMAAVWAYLFWQSDSPKMQLLWGLALLGELLGVGICGVIFTQLDVQLVMQREHRRIESQLLDMHERLEAMQKQAAAREE
jgi:hypothetical protein